MLILQVKALSQQQQAIGIFVHLFSTPIPIIRQKYARYAYMRLGQVFTWYEQKYGNHVLTFYFSRVYTRVYPIVFWRDFTVYTFVFYLDFKMKHKTMQSITAQHQNTLKRI
ncbi:Hypothetical_protein [Hexamita inflata]|uniref:Hypothetical_protein n=1 Tax=Hexamita inflata TaxID=28002 RepID=A0AA86TL47_9EUKA|nr:Hypothetical protein HINF_LOCUS6602 [Hexamita inflata]